MEISLMIRFTLTLLVFAMPSAVAAADDSAELLKSIQGEWHRTVDRDGRKIRIVKAIGSKQETLSYFIDQQVVYAHQVDFEVQVTEGGNEFSTSNKRVTAGPDAGQQSDEKGSYIFKVDQNKWFEVHRMMPDETGEPWINTYERAK